MGGGKWLIRKSLSIIENTCGINFVLIHNKKIIHLFNTHLEKEEKYTEGLHMASNHQSNYVNSHSRLTDMKFIYFYHAIYTRIAQRQFTVTDLWVNSVNHRNKDVHQVSNGLEGGKCYDI